MHSFIKNNTFEVPSLPGWGTGWGSTFKAAGSQQPLAANNQPPFANDIEKKKQYGIELAKRANQINAGFSAGCVIFDDTNYALWVAREWINDPIVLEARENHLKAVEATPKTLDRERFAARLLALSEEKTINGNNYTYEDKERVNLLELYAKVMGFTNNETVTPINNTLINGLTIKLVKPEEKPKTIIDVVNAPTTNNPIQNQNELPVKLKLVG